MQRYADAWFDDTVVLIESGRAGLRTDESPAVLSIRVRRTAVAGRRCRVKSAAVDILGAGAGQRFLLRDGAGQRVDTFDMRGWASVVRPLNRAAAAPRRRPQFDASAG